MRQKQSAVMYNSACRIGTVKFANGDEVKGISCYRGSKGKPSIHWFHEADEAVLFGKKVCLNINSIKRYLQLVESRKIHFSKEIEAAFLKKLKNLILKDFKKHHKKEFEEKLARLIDNGMDLGTIEKKLTEEFGLTHELFHHCLDLCGGLKLKRSFQRPESYFAKESRIICDSGLKILEEWFK